jgi:hypothetical protein
MIEFLATVFLLSVIGLKLFARVTCGVCRSQVIRLANCPPKQICNPFPLQNKLYGRTALITGANGDIGREIAKDLASRGVRVILACRNVKEGEILKGIFLA